MKRSIRKRRQDKKAQDEDKRLTIKSVIEIAHCQWFAAVAPSLPRQELVVGTESETGPSWKWQMLITDQVLG